MKIIFLDHDGCINPYNFEGNTHFDPKCIKIFNEIIEITNCEIIISSDWRISHNLKVLGDIYEDEGIIKKPISVTPNLYNSKEFSSNDITIPNFLEKLRSAEINKWLKDNYQLKIDKWCAVDDLQLLVSKFVRCDENIGLVEEGIKEKIVEYLK